MHDFRVLAHHRFHTARGVRWALSGSVATLLLSAILVAWSENIALGDALYFTRITGFTDGYGDLVATSASGRVLGVPAAMVGLLTSGIYVAVTTSAVARTPGERLQRASAPPTAVAAGHHHA